MGEFLDWLFSLERSDVLWALAAIGLLVNAASIVRLHGRIDRLGAELRERGVI